MKLGLIDDLPLFARTALAFCSHIESADTCEAAQLSSMCFRLIATLLSEVTDLPETPLISSGWRVSPEEYEGVVRRLKRTFGEKDCYRMVFDPYEAGAEPIYGSISNDLSDIWRDLKEGFAALRGSGIEDAVGQWRFSFAYHWGSHHASHVLKPLLALMLADGWYERED